MSLTTKLLAAWFVLLIFATVIFGGGYAYINHEATRLQEACPAQHIIDNPYAQGLLVQTCDPVSLAASDIADLPAIQAEIVENHNARLALYDVLMVLFKIWMYSAVPAVLWLTFWFHGLLRSGWNNVKARR